MAFAAGRPAVPSGPSLVAVGGLAGLALWTLISVGWAEAADAGLTDAARWLLYAALLAALLVAFRGRAARALLLAGAITPVLCLALVLVARLALGSGGDLFLNNRLHDPVGYVNGMAGYLMIAFWPMLAVAERARSAAVAGAAAGAASALAMLTILTQSRASVIALGLTAFVLLAIVPGRVRRAWALVAVLAGVAASTLALNDVIADLPAGATSPDAGALETAGLAIAGIAVLVGIAWGLARRVAAGLSGEAAVRVRSASAVALGVLAVGIGAAAVIPPGERYDEVRDQYDAFTELRAVEGGRLASGGGNRYDYWRIALDQFEEDPLQGAGPGDYEAAYFRGRDTAEDVRQAHSIELQVLGDTGLIGAVALGLFIGGVLWGAWRLARGGGRGPEQESTSPLLANHTFAVGAGGAFLTWLTHTSVDWLHLIPGLTGIALCAAAGLVSPSLVTVDGLRYSRARLALAGTVALAVMAAALFIGSLTLADHYRAQAEDRVSSDPQQALVDADRSLQLNDEALSAYYARAAAFARLGLYLEAREALLEAASREPDDFATWGLLGDLAARRGQIPQAHRYYRRAAELNPQDLSLAALAASRAAIEQAAAAAQVP